MLLDFNAHYLALFDEDSVSRSFTGFLPSFTGFGRVLLGFVEFYWVWSNFTGFCRILLGFVEFF